MRLHSDTRKHALPARFARRLCLLGAVGLTGALLAGCVFQDVKKQQAIIEATCTFQGTVTTEHKNTRPIVVALARHTGGDLNQTQNWVLADHYVLEAAGRWVFRASAGTYGLAAFEDSNADLVYQPGEPFLRVNTERPLICQAGDRKTDLALVIPTKGRSRLEGPIDIMAFQARTPGDQLQTSLGQATAAGEIVTLDDKRFSEEHAENGLWRPFDFLMDVRPGVYFLEPYTAAKTPVLFVHGINGTPINFRTLIERLDRKKFQPWVYYYPSGIHLGNIAGHLDQTMKKLQLQHGFTRYLVVAHSMGGLVSRAFLLRNQTETRRADIPLFVSISSPWGGVPFAAEGVKRAPTVVWVWYDMAPGSAFLRELFYSDPDVMSVRRPLPAGTTHHLLFGFKRKRTLFGDSDDQGVSVASQLHPPAQQDARRLYGFDESHMGILESAEVSQLVNSLLVSAGR